MPARHPGFGDARIWRCRACATEYASPQPSDERLSEIYSADYYDAWHLESPDVLRSMKAMTFQPLVDEIERGGAKTVLDVGCAHGEFLRSIDAAGYELFGVDRNATAIAAAAAAVPSAAFHAGTLEDEPFGDQRFDAITMIDFIEHVRDPEAELRHAAARLESGGRLLISTPRTDSAIARVTGRNWPQYREEHLVYFSLPGLSAVLQRAGLVMTRSFATRKAVTPAYVYGQATIHPLPVVTPVAKTMWRILPLARVGPRRLWFGEMTVVAERQGEPRR
jgi:2-polyprenyl-3-methyl-5-hydroxy-6-metoxy-1,4-benzoquinol methylase